jgi:cytochrome P450
MATTTHRGASSLNRPPTMPANLLIGSVRECLNSPLDLNTRAYQRFGDVVRIVAGPPGVRLSFYMVFHPDGVAQILNAGSAANYRKDSPVYNEIRGAFGNGLLTSEDDDWAAQRRIIQPLFTARRVDNYTALMAQEIERFARRWRAQPPGVVDLRGAMTELTLPLAVRVLFGDDGAALLPTLRTAFPALADGVSERVFTLLPLPASWPTPTNRRMRAARGRVRQVCDEITTHRRKHAIESDDLLGRLLAVRDDGRALSADTVRDQLMIFLFAGQETTSITLMFALRLLGQHPQIQDRVHAEAEAVLDGTPPSAAQAHALRFTLMVLKEATRLFPPAPTLSRRAIAADTICGYDIPAGAEVEPSAWVIHRRPDLWEDPERFDPERFAPEAQRGRHRYAWFPFGNGPRGCVGEHFALLEASLALAMLVREFRFETPPGEIPLTVRITLRPLAPVPVLVSKR